MEISKNIIQSIVKKQTYSSDEILSMFGVNSELFSRWIKLGVYNSDKTQAFRLKTQICNDSLIVSGKNLISFINQITAGK
jgi:hypothetical protein